MQGENKSGQSVASALGAQATTALEPGSPVTAGVLSQVRAGVRHARAVSGSMSLGGGIQHAGVLRSQVRISRGRRGPESAHIAKPLASWTLRQSVPKGGVRFTICRHLGGAWKARPPSQRDGVTILYDGPEVALG